MGMEEKRARLVSGDVTVEVTQRNWHRHRDTLETLTIICKEDKVRLFTDSPSSTTVDVRFTTQFDDLCRKGSNYTYQTGKHPARA